VETFATHLCVCVDVADSRRHRQICLHGISVATVDGVLVDTIDDLSGGNQFSQEQAQPLPHDLVQSLGVYFYLIFISFFPYQLFETIKKANTYTHKHHSIHLD